MRATLQLHTFPIAIILIEIVILVSILLFYPLIFISLSYNEYTFLAINANFIFVTFFENLDFFEKLFKKSLRNVDLVLQT